MFGKLKDTLSNTLAIVFGILLLIIFLPLILIVLVGFGVGAIWQRLFRKLRRDPSITVEQFVDLLEPDTYDEKEAFAFAKEYFNKLTGEIAKRSGATAGNMVIRRSKWGEEDDMTQRTITLIREVETKHATVTFDVDICEIKREDNTRAYYSCMDGDDISLVGSLGGKIHLSHLSRKEFDITVGYDQMAAEFCVALLRGKGWLNQQTGQLWAKLEDKNVWLVRYNQNDNSDIGVRTSRNTGKAREYWWDDPQEP